MKTTMKKLKKELLRFVENDNFKDLFVEKTHKLVTNTDERGILEITLKTLKEKIILLIQIVLILSKLVTMMVSGITKALKKRCLINTYTVG